MPLAAVCTCCQAPTPRRSRFSRFNDKSRIYSDASTFTPPRAEYATPIRQRRLLSYLTSSVPASIATTTALPAAVRPRFKRLRTKIVEPPPIEEKFPHDQTQSPLLGKMPFEVRQMIFRYALGREGWGGRALHLDTVLNSCDAPACKERKSDLPRQRRHDCSRCNNETGDKDIRKMILQGSMHLSALLRTCRKAYAETVAILYGHNTFLFHNAPDITLFLRSLPSTHLPLLHSIQLFAYIPTPISEVSPRICSFYVPDIYTWRVCCSALARLPNLKELIICLGMIHARKSMDHWIYPGVKQEANAAADRVLDCLKMIDRPMIFRVKIKRPWGESVGQLVGWAPFEFEVL
ncbi:MAG: hypothetical protein M1828_000547 [Chrysothrix sp. TS-e1954]|nr:MAG: hypothetical protein M1828_000547 [Chrysothrix sp. TS-e1954]